MAFEGLTEKLSNAFKKLRGKGRLSEADVKDAMREIRLALLEADVSYKVVKDFIKKTTERAVGTDVLESLTPAQMIVKIVNEELTALMGSENPKIAHGRRSRPRCVMLVGLQGAGKTTNGAKLAGLVQKAGQKSAARRLRRLPSGGHQTASRSSADSSASPSSRWGRRNPVSTLRKPASPTHPATGNDMVFLDTAGRLARRRGAHGRARRPSRPQSSRMRFCSSSMR